jgi:hypothetical protein
MDNHPKFLKKFLKCFKRIFLNGKCVGYIIIRCIQHMTNLWIGIKNENDKDENSQSTSTFAYIKCRQHPKGYEKQFHK